MKTDNQMINDFLKGNKIVKCPTKNRTTKETIKTRGSNSPQRDIFTKKEKKEYYKDR